MFWHQGKHEKRYVYDENSVGVANFEDANNAAQCVHDHNDAFARAERTRGSIMFQECGCLFGHPHAHRRLDTGGHRPGLYAVGRTEEVSQASLSLGPIMREFATEVEALAFIGTLLNHAGGDYYLNGPMRVD